MGLEGFAGFVAGAMFLDRPDPVAAWKQLGRFQEGLVERLARVRELRIEAPGTDLTLSVKGRKWVNSDGRRNMPSGEVFTGPLETSAEGRISFTIPSSPAGVGQRLEHHRLPSVRSRTGLRARAARAMRAGSLAASSCSS
ncbi:MAG: aminopeptidase [Solirubrobacterales bacterium]